MSREGDGLSGRHRSLDAGNSSEIDHIARRSGEIRKRRHIPLVAQQLAHGSSRLIELLVNRARTFIFTTGLSPADTAAAAAAVRICRSEEGNHLRARLRSLVEGFDQAPFRYLLTLRLLPLSPFGLVNVAAGCARAPFPAYVAATAIGAIPYSLIYSYLGAGLGHAFLGPRQPDASVLLRPEVGWPLVALGALCLVSARRKRRAEPA